MNKKQYIYYLLDFDFVLNDHNIYGFLRGLIYNGSDYDADRIYEIISRMKPLSHKEELLTLTQYIRNKKINDLLD
jgi:hypothetical protein